MTRTLLLALAVLGVAAALSIGSYAALAGSDPVSDAAGAVIGDDDPDGDDTDAVSEDTDEGDEASVASEGETGEGAEHVAQVIADAFGATQEEVLALHDEGIGFGALFKLYSLAQATGMSIDDLLASMQNGDGEFEFAFGQRFGELTDEQRAILESGPRNLGELVSASHHDGDGDGGVTEADASPSALEQAQAKFAAKSSRGHGPPESVPAHGRN